MRREIAMKKRMVTLLALIVLFSLSCQFLTRSVGSGTVITNCADVVSAVRSLQPGRAPQALLETGVKQGDEFDTNEYFTVLPDISWIMSIRWIALARSRSCIHCPQTRPRTLP
jgi:hypothetical protein